MARETGRKDIESVISWLKEELEYYKDNIGEVKDYGLTKKGMAKSITKITKKLVKATKSRIKQLEDKL